MGRLTGHDPAASCVTSRRSPSELQTPMVASPGIKPRSALSQSAVIFISLRDEIFLEAKVEELTGLSALRRRRRRDLNPQRPSFHPAFHSIRSKPFLASSRNLGGPPRP